MFKQICKWNIVGKDLIPIIEYCQEDRNLVLNAGNIDLELRKCIRFNILVIFICFDYICSEGVGVSYHASGAYVS